MDQSWQRRASYHKAVTPDQADALFMLCICIVGGLGFSLRLLGPLYLLIPLLCAFYGARQMLPPLALSAYAALCTLYAVLSYLRVLPTSWQTVFVDAAIVRQMIPILSFFAIAWGSKAYFGKCLYTGRTFANERMLLFLCLVCAPIVMFTQGFRYQEDDSASSVLAVYGALLNNISIALFFIMGRLFIARDWSRVLAGATIVLIAATTHFIQFRVLAATALAMLLGVPGRLAACGVVTGMVVLYGFEMHRINEVIISRPNSGLRLAFILDTFRSLIDTYGIGIGFGKNSVRWVYHFPGVPDFTFMPDARTITTERLLELLSRGVHNSFAQAALRTGLPGVLLLIVAFAAAFPARHLPRRIEAHASMMYVTIYIACFVNPGLESPVQLVGIGFIYGYLLALRAWAGARNHRHARIAQSGSSSGLRTWMRDRAPRRPFPTDLENRPHPCDARPECSESKNDGGGPAGVVK